MSLKALIYVLSGSEIVGRPRREQQKSLCGILPHIFFDIMSVSLLVFCKAAAQRYVTDDIFYLFITKSVEILRALCYNIEDKNIKRRKMLKDKIKIIIKAVDGTIVKVAGYSGMAAANIGKLTNGSRIPARKSSTAYKLTNGIYGFSEANGKLGVLCETIGCDASAGKKKIRKALLDWLYEDVTELDDRTEGFTQRINSLMSVVGVSIPEVCKATGKDHSLLSAYCDGSKIPTRRSKYLVEICGGIYALAEDSGALESVAELLGIQSSVLTGGSGSMILRDWLLGRNEDRDLKAATSLIHSITAPTAPPKKLPGFGEAAPEEILSESKTLYVGIGGLQRAVIRFLGNAARCPGSELLLYSDQSMEWMQERFAAKWQSLMLECLKNGVRMKIIHNINRDPSEMLFAVQSWLPLYMTGLIEPYYRTDESGSRFCHTIFISGSDCIDGFCPSGAERGCLYHYITDSDSVGDVRRSYERLLSGIKPLLVYERGSFVTNRQYTVYDCGSVRIYLSYTEAVVVKLTEPCCSFTLKHPYLIRAISMYAYNFGTETGDTMPESAANQ